MVFESIPQLWFYAIGAVAVLLVIFLLTRTKYVYFVRHGETLLNKEHIKQGAEGALSEAGEAQARIVGAALKDSRIEALYTSPYERARQTATLMNESLHKKIHVNDLLAERRNASEVIGKPTDDPEVVRIMGLTAYGYHDDSYRYADEENFTDLKSRARKCLSYLETRGESTVCAVTHHAFLHMLLSYMVVGEGLHADGYVKLSFFNPAENGGITVCQYEPLKRFTATRGWTILMYNALADTPPQP